MEYQNFCSSIHKVLGKVCKLRGKFISQHDLMFKNSIFQQSSFAKSCRQNGGLFKCCFSPFTLSIYEKSRNSLILEGLIKDRPTNWCPETLDENQMEGPCIICTSDAMCTKRNNNTGEIRNTYLRNYTKEQRVIRCHFFLLFSCIGWRGAVVGPRLTSWP